MKKQLTLKRWIKRRARRVSDARVQVTQKRKRVSAMARRRYRRSRGFGGRGLVKNLLVGFGASSLLGGGILGGLAGYLLGGVAGAVGGYTGAGIIAGLIPKTTSTTTLYG